MDDFDTALLSAPDAGRLPPEQGALLATWPRRLLLLAIALAFVDESLRKALPGQPVLVTAPKLLLVLLAGLYMLMHGGTFIRAAGAFVPWLIYALMSSLYVAMLYRSPVHFAACVQTYVAGPLLVFAAGMYLALDDWGRGRAMRWYCIGAAVAVVVAGLQEVARPALPGFLSARVYKEMHSGAGGMFDESLFATSQILSQCLVLAAMGLFVHWSAGQLRRPGRGVVLLAMCAIGIYLARIRIGMAFLIAGMAAVFVFVKYAMGYSSAKRARMVGGVVLMTAVLGIILMVGYRGWLHASDVNVSADQKFYSVLTNPQDIIQRILLPFREVGYTGSGLNVLGYGAGTTGILKRFLPDGVAASLPQVSDSGMALLSSEFGLVGLLLFVVPILWLLGSMLMRMKRFGHVPPEVIWNWIAAAIFTAWFLLKSHSVIENAFSQMMWFGSLGICWGLLTRQQGHECET